MKTMQNDLDFHGLSWTEAVDLAQNRRLKALHGQAPQCLTDDCQLVAAAGRRQQYGHLTPSHV